MGEPGNLRNLMLPAWRCLGWLGCVEPVLARLLNGTLSLVYTPRAFDFEQKACFINRESRHPFPPSTHTSDAIGRYQPTPTPHTSTKSIQKSALYPSRRPNRQIRAARIATVTCAAAAAVEGDDSCFAGCVCCCCCSSPSAAARFLASLSWIHHFSFSRCEPALADACTSSSIWITARGPPPGCCCCCCCCIRAPVDNIVEDGRGRENTNAAPRPFYLALLYPVYCCGVPMAAKCGFTCGCRQISNLPVNRFSGVLGFCLAHNSAAFPHFLWFQDWT